MQVEKEENLNKYRNQSPKLFCLVFEMDNIFIFMQKSYNMIEMIDVVIVLELSELGGYQMGEDNSVVRVMMWMDMG